VLLADEADVPAGDGWLTAGEQAILDQLRVPARRRDWRLGRWVAKHAVAAVVGDSAPIEVHAAEDGAPEVLIAGLPAPVNISISHRAGVGACLVASRDITVGCDLELVEPRDRALARHFFTPSEVELVDRVTPEDHDLVVALVWSAKESALKALRQGLRLDAREVEVMLDPDGGAASDWRSLAVRCSAGVFGGWWRVTGRRHVLTVVTHPASVPPAPLSVSGGAEAPHTEPA